MSGVTPKEPKPVASWVEAIGDLTHQYFTAVEKCLDKYVAPPKPTRGPEFGSAPELVAPTHWVSGKLHIDSDFDGPVRLHCRGLRQVGGGTRIPPERISFEPDSVDKGPNIVQARVDMTDIGVGIWIGEIVSAHNPTVRLSPNPLMPTWAGGG